jgi:hypothetical protein
MGQRFDQQAVTAAAPVEKVNSVGLQLADDVDDMLHFLSKRCANALCLR